MPGWVKQSVYLSDRYKIIKKITVIRSVHLILVRKCVVGSTIFLIFFVDVLLHFIVRVIVITRRQ